MFPSSFGSWGLRKVTWNPKESPKALLEIEYVLEALLRGELCIGAMLQYEEGSRDLSLDFGKTAEPLKALQMFATRHPELEILIALRSKRARGVEEMFPGATVLQVPFNVSSLRNRTYDLVLTVSTRSLQHSPDFRKPLLRKYARDGRVLHLVESQITYPSPQTLYRFPGDLP